MITSEPYVVFTKRGYQPAVDIIDTKTKKEFFLYIGAKSLAVPLETLRQENDGNFKGLEFWVRKESNDRMARYVIEE